MAQSIPIDEVITIALPLRVAPRVRPVQVTSMVIVYFDSVHHPGEPMIHARFL